MNCILGESFPSLSRHCQQWLPPSLEFEALVSSVSLPGPRKNKNKQTSPALACLMSITGLSVDGSREKIVGYFG